MTRAMSMSRLQKLVIAALRHWDSDPRDFAH